VKRWMAKFLFSVLGLMLTTTAAHADVPPTVKLFGQDYNVVLSKRVGTFKNGVAVAPQTPTSNYGGAEVYLRANLAFWPGANADGSADQLLISAPHQDDVEINSDGLYVLKGNQDGAFSLANSDATVIFRGNKQVTGRLQTLTFINDTDTGPKDRNLYAYTFTEANMMRWYDLGELLKGAPHTEDLAFRNLAVFSIIELGLGDTTYPPDPSKDTQPDDPNMPAGSYLASAIAPNGTQIVLAQSGGNWQISAIDPQKGTTFYPVKTEWASTAAADKVDMAETPTSFIHLTGDEYLLLGIGGDPNSTEDQITSSTLYHVRVTLPADLTKEAADSIKVDVLEKEDLVAAKLGQSPNSAIAAVTLGRNNATGKPNLYMTDWDANLLTLQPK
jgi:hypothetical protein